MKIGRSTSGSQNAISVSWVGSGDYIGRPPTRHGRLVPDESLNWFVSSSDGFLYTVVEMNWVRKSEFSRLVGGVSGDSKPSSRYSYDKQTRFCRKKGHADETHRGLNSKIPRLKWEWGCDPNLRPVRWKSGAPLDCTASIPASKDICTAKRTQMSHLSSWTTAPPCSSWKPLDWKGTTYTSREQLTGFSIRWPSLRSWNNLSMLGTDGYGVPPSVMISHNRIPKDQTSDWLV